MIPITLANIGEEKIIKRISVNSVLKKHLESLGFVAGAPVTPVSASSGDVIVNIKGSRIAIGKESAQKIFI